VRSVLFVPGNRPDWMSVAASKYHPDALIFDLEDAVPSSEKTAARELVREAIESQDPSTIVLVRLNALDTGMTAEDVHSVVAPGLAAVILPKTVCRDDLVKVGAWLDHAEARAGLPRGSTLIMTIPESPLGMMNAFELAQTDRVWCVIGGYGSKSGDTCRSI